MERPLFLVGAPRSGSSLLYKALCLHREAAYISNWVSRFPGAPQLAAANRLAAWLPSAQRAVWFGGGDAAYVYGGRRTLWHRAFPMPVEGEPLYRRTGAPAAADHDLPAVSAALAKAFGRLRRAGGGQLVVSKRIANNRRIPLLAAAFPGARFVELVRDGRAVAASLARVDWWPDSRLWWFDDLTPLGAAVAGADPWELCGRAWVEETAAAHAGLATIAADQVLRTTYERFVAEPAAVLDEVARFAGLGASRDWERRLAGVQFPDRNRAWRTDLPAAAVATIERVQGHALADHGYA
jgi:hypothetical protein